MLEVDELQIPSVTVVSIALTGNFKHHRREAASF